MRIRKRPNGWWYAIGDGGERYSLRTKDHDEALRLAAESRKRPQGHTVAEIMKAYLADKSDRPSHERMDFAWMRLKAHFGHLRPEQITRESCRTYIANRRKAHISDGTIRKEMTTLRAAVNHSNKSSGAVFVLPPAPAPKERHLTRKEYKALMGAAKANHLRLFIALALATAGRKEAILDLTWDRVNFDSGRINLGRGSRQKGRAVVSMGDELRAWLADAYEGRTCEHVIEWAGDRVKNIRKGFDTACATAKLKNVTPHTLRHTAAVWMAEDGRPMSEIAQVLGHSDSRTTERVYARFSPDYLVKTTAVLDSALSRK